jgi:Rad3-related DNA helicase
MPYIYLLDEKLSTDEIGPLIENSVIIIDEAHNISNVCESSK